MDPPKPMISRTGLPVPTSRYPTSPAVVLAISVGAVTMSGGPGDGVPVLADAGTAAPAPQAIVSAAAIGATGIVVTRIERFIP